VSTTSLSSPWTPLIKWLPVLFWLLFLWLAVKGVVKHDDIRGLYIFLLLLFTPIAIAWFVHQPRLPDGRGTGAPRLPPPRRGVNQRVDLADVLNVTPGPVNIPTIVRIRLRSEGPFGDEVGFAARLESVSTWSSRLKAVETLLAAVDAAKLGARG